MASRRRRHLSRAHRAAIAQGLARYWRGIRRAKAKRRTQARARRALQKIQRTAPKRLRPAQREEWEVTIRYHPTRRGQAIGLTMRIVAPVGTPRDVILIVAKRAGQSDVERGFQVHTINWQKPLGGARAKTFAYGEDVETGLQVPGFTGLFAAADVRAERVKP